MGLLGIHAAALSVVSFFVFIVTNVYVTVFVILVFYDISGLERRDVKPYQAVPLPVVKKTEPAHARAEREVGEDENKPKPAKKSSGKPKPATEKKPAVKTSKTKKHADRSKKSATEQAVEEVGDGV